MLYVLSRIGMFKYVTQKYSLESGNRCCDVIFIVENRDRGNAVKKDKINIQSKLFIIKKLNKHKITLKHFI